MDRARFVDRLGDRRLRAAEELRQAAGAFRICDHAGDGQRLPLHPPSDVYLAVPARGRRRPEAADYWPASVVFAIVVVAVYLIAKAEEQDTPATFGAAYPEYMKTSEMFIPFVL